MSWAYLSKTVTRRNANVEPPGRVLQRVLYRYALFMSLVVNGTAVNLGEKNETAHRSIFKFINNF